MSFSIKTWFDRVSEYPNRRILTKSDGTTEQVTVTRDEGEVATEGTPFSAEEMNELEQRIADEFETLNNSLTCQDTDTSSFYFDYQDGEYGFNTSSERGADTFHPFSSVKKLYEALQYSGLVTEDMTFDEICAVLAELYPQKLIQAGVENITITPYYMKKAYSSSGYMTYKTNGNAGNGYAYSENTIPTSAFDTLNVTFSASSTRSSALDYAYIGIATNPPTSGIVKQYTTKALGSSSSVSKTTIQIDVSSITYDAYLWFRVSDDATASLNIYDVWLS